MFWPLSFITFSMNSPLTVFSEISIGMDFSASSKAYILSAGVMAPG
jgi:hypothetical protein